MKRILLLFIGLLFLFSCQLDDDFITPISINSEITSDYLLSGDLDSYLAHNQIFRYKGKPGIETIPVGNENLSNYEECFVLYVASGQNATNAVSSAIIKLDGFMVLNTSDFSNSECLYTFEICNLTEQSVLDVEVRGQPGSYIDIWFEGKLKELTVTDIDDNVYKTVKICDQVWMAENLKTTKLNDGTPIPNVTNGWYGTSPRYCWVYNNPENKDVYGALYNWYTVNTGQLCPVGWHVPSDEEWYQLSLCLDPNAVKVKYYESYTAGGKLKETGFDHWESPNTGATNETGFTARAGGYRAYNEPFEGFGQNVNWWSTTMQDQSHAWQRYVGYNNTYITRDEGYLEFGVNVRCVKD
jgi:uncharacterized protein (TIGR02145 family)